jgi:hypothetical protein
MIVCDETPDAAPPVVRVIEEEVTATPDGILTVILAELTTLVTEGVAPK